METLSIEQLHRFESIGDNCEFAFFLRKLGNDNGTLLRWALIKDYHYLVKMIKSDFIELYSLNNLVPSWQDMVLDKQYHICFHTEMYSDIHNGEWAWRYTESENKIIYQNEKNKIDYLVKKFKESIENNNKIFVIKKNNNDIDDVVKSLADEFKKKGNSKILYVKSNLNNVPLGEVIKKQDNLLIASIDKFAPYDQANNFSEVTWKKIVNNALAIL